MIYRGYATTPAGRITFRRVTRVIPALLLALPHDSRAAIECSALKLTPGATATCEFRTPNPGRASFLLRLPATGWSDHLTEVACGTDCPTDAATICQSLVEAYNESAIPVGPITDKFLSLEPDVLRPAAQER